MENQEQQEQGSEDKVGKQFDSNFKKLIALLGGEAAFRKVKIDNDETSTLVEELLKERKAEKLIEFKDKAKKLLDKKVEFDKEVKKAEEEFKNKVNTKKKEFTEEMKSLFNIVENIDELQKNYYNSIKEVQEEEILKAE